MILIKNGRVVDPKSGTDKICDILIKDNLVHKMGENIECSQGYIIIDATDKIVTPGFIDVHVHFRDPGFTYKEDIFSGSKAAAMGGYTTVVCMANTNPVVDNEDTLNYIKEKSKKSCINILQTSSITVGLKGNSLVDMKHLRSKGAVGFTDDGMPIMNSKVVIDAMMLAKKLNVPLSFHEEDPLLIENSGINQGEISNRLNIGGAMSAAEEVMVARDCILALKTKAKVNIQHVSSGLTVDIIRFFKSLGANITAEISPHHFSLIEDAVLKYGTNAKMNPPLRTKEDQIKLIEGLKDNTIEIIATDHAPHNKEDKEKELLSAPSGIIGLETALSLGITNLVLKNHISLMQLIEKMTINPAKLYNLDSGSLSVGSVADITIFDLTEKYIVENFKSKSNNSPFIGQELCGKVKYTICSGQIIYQE